MSPWRWARIAALVPAAVAHFSFYAETRMAFTGAVLFACTALFLLPHRFEARARRLRLEWGETVGACILVVFLLGTASSVAGWSRPWHATRRVLSDLGLAPPAARLLANGQVRAARVESEVASGRARHVLELDVESPRHRALIGLSAAAELAPLSDLRQRLAQRHATAFCRHFSSYEGSAELVVETTRGEVLPLAWLSCPGHDSAATVVVLLEAAHAAQETP